MRVRYGVLLDWSLHNRLLFGSIFLGFCVGSLALIPLLGSDLLPYVDAGRTDHACDNLPPSSRDGPIAPKVLVLRGVVLKPSGGYALSSSADIVLCVVGPSFPPGLLSPKS